MMKMNIVCTTLTGVVWQPCQNTLKTIFLKLCFFFFFTRTIQTMFGTRKPNGVRAPAYQFGHYFRRRPTETRRVRLEHQSNSQQYFEYVFWKRLSDKSAVLKPMTLRSVSRFQGAPAIRNPEEKHAAAVNRTTVLSNCEISSRDNQNEK